MALTFAQAQTFLLESLGADAADLSALDVAGYINRAGQALVAMHAWNFLVVPPVSLNLTIDDAFVPLPSDWGSVIVLWDTVTRHKIERDPLEIVARKRAGDGLADIRTYAVSWSGHSSGEPVARLELSWTPGAAATAALQLTYRTRWSAVVSGDTLGIPHYAEGLYLDCLLAVGKGWEESDEAQAMVLLEALSRSMVFKQAARQDGELSADMGILPSQRPGWFVDGPRVTRVVTT